MTKRKIQLKACHVDDGVLSFSVWMDERHVGYGDLYARDAGDLVEEDGLPSVGGSPEVFDDDEISDDVRALAIQKARELGMTWPGRMKTWYIVKAGEDLMMTDNSQELDQELVVAEWEGYELEDANKYFEGFRDGWLSFRQTLRDLLGVGP